MASVEGGASSRLQTIAPVPFVGAAAILVALIVFTPVLLASGPSPLAVRAELVVYRVVGSPTTQFYVHAVGSDVPYATIDLALGSGFAWSGGSCPGTVANWTYVNETNRLDLLAVTDEDPVLVRATATYNQSSGPTIYAGELAFDVVNPGSSGESLTIVPCASTPGLSPPGSIATADLPLSLYLVNFGSGGPPS